MTCALLKAIFSSGMYVCLCRGVSDRTVQEVIERGARTIGEIGARCGAGTDCGSCHEALARRIAAATGDPSRACAGCPGDPPLVASAVEEKAA